MKTLSCLTVLTLLALGGCTTLSSDGGFGPIEQVAKDRLGQEVKWARSEADRESVDNRVTQLLEQPLSADAAVQIALLNNKGLQASL